jgi:hypothetical protein
MLIKQNLKREKKKKRRRQMRVEEKRSWGEKRGERKKEIDVDVFYLRVRRRRKGRRRSGSSIMKWGILFIEVFYRWIIKYQYF